MSERFSLAAPPSSGKVSRREKVSRSGRSIDLSNGSQEFSPSSASAAQQRERIQSHASIQEEEGNPFEAAPARRAPPQQQATGLQSRPPPAAAPVNADLFSFFDPLAQPAPAPKPQAPVQQRPVAVAADPFSAAFSQQLSFDPFAAAAPVAAAPAAKSPNSAAAAAAKKVVKANKVESSDSDSESDSSSSSSDDSSDSDSSSDSDAAPSRQKKKAKNTAKSAAKANTAVNQMGRSATAAASSIAQTSNRTLSVPGSAAAAATSSSQSNSASSSSMTVDVLALMHKGTPFLKYGKAGFPHFRQFQLSADNTRLEWFSSSKKLKDTQVQLALVDSIRLGQTTANFARHPAPDLAKSSFSLIYDHGRSTLDLIAKDPNDFLVFTRGLGELIRISQEGRPGELERLTSLNLNLGIQTTRRSSVEIVDAVTGQSAAAAAGAAASRGRALSTNNKMMYKEVAQSFQKLKYKLNKRREELRSQGFYMHPQYPSMDAIVRRVQDSITKCNEWFQDGEYGLCDDEIWRAGVDLESLKNMMVAVGAQR